MSLLLLLLERNVSDDLLLDYHLGGDLLGKIGRRLLGTPSLFLWLLVWLRLFVLFGRRVVRIIRLPFVLYLFIVSEVVLQLLESLFELKLLRLIIIHDGLAE